MQWYGHTRSSAITVERLAAGMPATRSDCATRIAAHIIIGTKRLRFSVRRTHRSRRCTVGTIHRRRSGSLMSSRRMTGQSRGCNRYAAGSMGKAVREAPESPAEPSRRWRTPDAGWFGDPRRFYECGSPRAITTNASAARAARAIDTLHIPSCACGGSASKLRSASRRPARECGGKLSAQ